MAGTEPTAWDRLLGVATLGTRRTPVNETLLWPTAELAPAGADAAAELKFLRAVAARRLYDVAGTRSTPQPASDEHAPVPVDRTRFVSEVAAMRLLRMIRGQHAELIPEWSQLALEAGRQVPPQFVPLVLTHLKPTDAKGFGDLLGPTGQWLVRLNPDWKIAFTVEAPSHDHWLSGTLDERRSELLALRKQDPAQAREWLQETWAKDPPDEREAFLRLFTTGLSLADESFLEAALDDKRKPVRQAAVQLLASLPESQLSRRHGARLDALIAADEKKGLLARKLGRPKLKLNIILPEAIDKATQRDGVDAKVPANRKIGERAFWLSQMVALVPLSYWTTRFQCEPALLVAGVMETDYAGELLTALSEAAQRHPEREWLLALTDGWLATKDAQVRAERIVEVLQNAPDEVREAVLAAQLSKLDSLRDHYMILALLQTVQFGYGPELTRLAIAHLRTIATKQKSTYQQPRNLFDPIGYHCDVPTASELVPAVLDAVSTDSNWRNAVEQLNDIVEFRAAMRREIL
jgi:hypothetical protein